MTKKTTKLFLFATLAVSFSLISAMSFGQSAVINGPAINCQGNPLTLSVTVNGLLPPLTYAWTNGDTGPTTTINATTLIRVAVTGTNSSGSQQTVNSPWRVFLFLPSPTATINASGPTNLCDGQSVTLTASGGNFFSTYSWSNGQNGPTITVNSTGNYTVTVRNFGGCTATASQQVNVYSTTNAPKITASGPTTFCFPGSVTLTADPGFSSYLWSTGETTQSITVTLYGSGAGVPLLDTVTVSYSVSINSNCEVLSEPVLVRSIRKPQLLTQFCPNYNLSLDDSIKTGIVLPIFGIPSEYDFNFEETTNPGSNIVIHSASRWLKLSDVTPALEVGKFYLVRTRGVVDGVPYCYGAPCAIGIIDNFSSRGNLRVFTDDDGEQIYVYEGLNFGVYPNPSNTNFTAQIFTHNDNDIVATVFDMTGRVLSTETFSADTDQYAFGDNLKPGMYIVEFNQGGLLRQTTKIIKTE
ncbi:MAG: T9SS type A sorting domain-containing protein [Bacteroidia bacterium]|nr:T9SS type A sorting domain-containing protein [Bacteroidia bacterium]MCZ2277118.1 T9SS type A sorting domain-containing protein [Bacteroidia bacterium]